MAAPAENVTADVSAACTGRAVVIFEIPSSSRACAVKGSFVINCWATLPRKGLVDAAPDVDIGKLVKLERGVLAQLLTLAREVRPFCIGLRADRHIFAGGHRHGAGHQAGDTGDQDGVLRRGRRGDADDQACGRDNAVVGSEHRGSQPTDAVDEVILPMQAKAPVRSEPTKQHEDDNDDQDGTDDTDAAVTLAVAVAAEAAAKATEQEDNKQNDENES
jgi:hypothetical protein